MAFKNELSLRSSVLVVSKNPSSPSNHLFQVDMADNLFQSSFALRFQKIKIPSFLRRSVGNKVGLRVDTQWGERATQRSTILVETESGAPSNYSVELWG